MNKPAFKSLIAISLVLFVTSLFAQPPAPPATPIDGGLSLLLAVGGILGVSRLLRKVK